MHLRDYQKQAIEACVNHLETKSTNPILSLTGGAGKSVIIAKIAEILNKQCLIVADRKELLSQNHSKFHPDCDVGIVSAGLDLWEFDKQIVIGGIQTIYNKTKELGERDYIIIDECDLYNGVDGMYHQLIKAYPQARVIGLTGTPFRAEEGILKWGEIIYNISYADLLSQGYLSPITNKIAYKPDLSNVTKVAGDYSEKSLKEQYLDKANIGDWIEKLKPYVVTRQKWLVFLPSVEYAEQFAFALSAIRVRARAITGSTSKADRDNWIREFKNGELQALVGVGVFERGFDVPDVDLIVDLSPTKSLKKWLQRIWRGVRIAENKKDCWYLDFAGNLKEHGSIHNQDWLLENGEIKIKKKYVEKICPACETYIPAFAKTCPHCFHDFIAEQIKKKARLEADTESDINSEWKPKEELKWYYVKEVYYDPEYVAKRSGYKMLRVTYKISESFNVCEYIFNRDRAKWLIQRGWSGGAIKWLELKKPKQIAIKQDGKFLKVERCKWE